MGFQNSTGRWLANGSYAVFSLEWRIFSASLQVGIALSGVCENGVLLIRWNLEAEDSGLLSLEMSIAFTISE